MNTLSPRAARAATPVYRRLTELGKEFDQAATHYERFRGQHNTLLATEARRASAQLAVVADFVRTGIYSQAAGALWIRASWRIITAIGRTHLR